MALLFPPCVIYGMVNKKLEVKIKNLPASPGVYLFKNREGKIIYIGKAKNLKNRVRTYFQSPQNHNIKTSHLVTATEDFDLMITDSEIEALILEANLVKEYRPRYNINLKDDKHFPYIKVTINEPFPRILIVRHMADDGGRYFGPYTSGKAVRKTVNFLNCLFKIRSCNLTITKTNKKPQKVCLDYHIGRCEGPCEGRQSEKKYKEQIDSALLFLSGKSQTLIEKLKGKMETASRRMKFEDAACIRDQLDSLESISQKQKVDVGKLVNRDIIAYAREERDIIIIVLQIREGLLIGRQDFQLHSEMGESDAEIVSGFISQYYNHQPNLPDEIYLPCALTDERLIEQWLSGGRGRKVQIFIPQKGQKLKLVDMAAANARLLLDELLIQKKGYKERTSKSVQVLKDNLHLAILPRTMACVDISNTGESDAVGSLVYFENGRPKKSEYRHFKIKNVKGQNDFAMMREVVGRYFYRLKEENRKAPDLLIVDGGKGQLSSAATEIRSLGFNRINLIGLAKKFEEIYLVNHREPLTLPKTSPGLGLLKRIRDEAHRFAVEYNRKLRTKRTIQSELIELEGIGAKRLEILIRHFGSVKRIKAATLEELMAVKGIPRNVAQMIFHRSH
ncbi:MAG: excinuclease ABC subunit UvrC [candidate division Zixibacteria bacterium]|nr:excinuclease ABC subunit UvrC [candidate division Zixibacteria bacterium]